MAKKCEICGKGKLFGNKVSHSNRKTRTAWEPNLRSVRTANDGRARRIQVCTRCLRSGKVVKPA